jgi:hypothetical protein
VGTNDRAIGILVACAGAVIGLCLTAPSAGAELSLAAAGPSPNVALSAAGPSVANPLANPAANRLPPELSIATGPCAIPPGGEASCQSPCYPNDKLVYNDSPQCATLVLTAINDAQIAEHLHQFDLPNNFAQLTVTRQMFVLVNLERISRGVPPLAGISPYLSAAATTASQKAQDPAFHTSYGPVKVWYPPKGGTYAFGGAWAGNSVNALSAVFGWMYDDGWAGKGQTSNFACSSAHATGCWGHRDELLGEYSGTTCPDCVAGTGYTSPTAQGWVESYDVLIVRPMQFPTPMVFTWDTNVVPHLPAGWERAPAA